MTATTALESRPTLFWVIAILALLWNLMGVFAFVMQVNMSPDVLAALPDAERQLIASQPAWFMFVFAIAVFAGALGSLMLLLKKKFAMPLLVLSLLGVLAQKAYVHLFSDIYTIMGSGAMVLSILVIVIALFLVWFARMSIAKGWIG